MHAQVAKQPTGKWYKEIVLRINLECRHELLRAEFEAFNVNVLATCIRTCLMLVMCVAVIVLGSTFLVLSTQLVHER
eukprot:5831759-Amphidinium_carterae.1